MTQTMTQQRKKILIVCRKPPYGSSITREAIDIALATAAFDQELALLFLADGVYQLLEGQNSDDIESKNHGKVVSALPLYDIDKLYVESDALNERNLQTSQFVVPVEALSNEQIKQLMASHAIIFNF